MKDQPGLKYVWVVWAGTSPFSKFAELELQKRYGIEMATGGITRDGGLQANAGMERAVLLLRHREQGQRMAGGQPP